MLSVLIRYHFLSKPHCFGGRGAVGNITADFIKFHFHFIAAEVDH